MIIIAPPMVTGVGNKHIGHDLVHARVSGCLLAGSKAIARFNALVARIRKRIASPRLSRPEKGEQDYRHEKPILPK
jgi:hypothetical protein